jgi:dinuclear metal center YbgI/SA1388 family protein
MREQRVVVDRDELADYLGRRLDITRFRDYCPNGLQVQGRPGVSKVITGVTASVALIEEAIRQNADAILVHHGYFWRGEDARVIGTKHQRLKLLLAHDINLFAYHLPLDMHPELGNNAQLARVLGLQSTGRFGENDLGWLGEVEEAAGIKTVADLAVSIEARLGRAPLVIGDTSLPAKRLAWCTGAAQNMLADAIAAGAAVYLSGEISEPTVHLAREAGACYLSCGHHATERYGVQALGKDVAQRFGIAHEFIDIPNPV